MMETKIDVSKSFFFSVVRIEDSENREIRPTLLLCSIVTRLIDSEIQNAQNSDSFYVDSG